MWSLNLNLVFKPTPFKLLLATLAQIILYCHVMIMHHIVALHWLCSLLFAGGCSLSVQMDFIQIDVSCISSNHIISPCHDHASYCCIAVYWLHLRYCSSRYYDSVLAYWMHSNLNTKLFYLSSRLVKLWTIAADTMKRISSTSYAPPKTKRMKQMTAHNFWTTPVRDLRKNQETKGKQTMMAKKMLDN